MKINNTIVNSIPLKKDAKRYFLAKYRHLCKHNGSSAAEDVFKNLGCYLKSFRSGEHNIACPVKRTGWVKYLEQSMLTNPQNVLNFLKLYTMPGTINVETASRVYHESVSSIDVDTSAPVGLTEWLRILKLTKRARSDVYIAIRKNKLHCFHAFASGHSLRDWSTYWAKWRKITTFDDAHLDKRDWFTPITPEMYKDSGNPVMETNASLDHSPASASFIKDFETLSYILDHTKSFTPDTRRFVYDVNSEYFKMLSSSTVLDPDDLSTYTRHQTIGSSESFNGACVGDVHFIPKHGSDFRAIAVPNRFLQSALVPGYQALESIVKRLPHDCTFNQQKFNEKITSRVSSKDLFCYGIDLSKATDNLPLNWGVTIWSTLLSTACSDVQDSLKCFMQMSRAPWFNQGFFTSWSKGQPLGTLPSFQCLALTHNIVCEYLSLQCGQGHSPYAVLGDDLIVFNKKLKKAYFGLLASHKIPVSLHKSYGGNLVEFAGQTFISNAKPFYTPAHNILTFESLFDYQRSSGISIPWHNLPRGIRTRFIKSISEVNVSGGKVFSDFAIPGQTIYKHCQKIVLVDRGTQSQMFNFESVFYEAWGVASAELQKEPEVGRLIPTPTTNSHVIGNKVISVVSSRHGFNYSFKRSTLPDWYKDKFRPCSTDKLIATGYIIQQQLASKLNKV